MGNNLIFQPHRALLEPAWTADMRNIDTIEERADDQHTEAARTDHMTKMPGKRQQLSSEQWNAHKSFIRTLYLEDDKTFDQVAAELGKIHGFSPTKRQFTRKLSEWRFKKNTNRDERILIMRNTSKTDGDQATEILGRKLHKHKLRRWRKDFSKNDESHPIYENLNSTTDVSLGKFTQDVLYNVSDKATPARKGWKPNQNGHIEFIDRAPLERFDRPTYLESWATVDLPGSPKMSRFLELIKIEMDSPPENIDPLILPGPHKMSAQMPEKSVAGFHLKGAFSTSKRAEQELSNNDLPAIMKKKKTLKLPFRFVFDVWFPSGVLVAPNPYRELYPFPIPENDFLQECNGKDATTKIIDLQTLEKELEDTLRTLYCLERGGCTDSRLLIGDTLEDLGSVYSQQGKYREAERLYRVIIHEQERLGLHKSRTSLWAHVMLHRSLNLQNRNKEAFKSHEVIHANITNEFLPDDRLTLASLGLQGDLFAALKQFDKSEKLSRQVLQISLNSFGPKHVTTLFAIRDLARAIYRQALYQDSEELLVILLQLQQTTASPSIEDTCLYNKNLAESIYHQGRYSEALKLITEVVDTAVLRLGENHPTTLLCYRLLAWSLHKMGRSKEGKLLLDHCILLHFNLKTNSSPQDSDAMSATRSYGRLLLDRKEYPRAAQVLARAFKMYISAFGPSHESTIACCEDLARCYEAQGRLEDARLLFENLISQTRASMMKQPHHAKGRRDWIVYLRDPEIEIDIEWGVEEDNSIVSDRGWCIYIRDKSTRSYTTEHEDLINDL